METDRGHYQRATAVQIIVKGGRQTIVYLFTVPQNVTFESKRFFDQKLNTPTYYNKSSLRIYRNITLEPSMI